MKVIKNSLNESKQALPVDFITNFVSKGWEEVGTLNASIEGIKQSFKGTNKVEEILQGLIDAYLIALGQFEAYLSNKNHIELPEDDIKESLKEDLDENTIELDDVDVTANQHGDKVKIELELKDEEDKNEIVNDKNLDAVKDNFKPPMSDNEIDDIDHEVFQRGDFAEYGKDVDLAAHDTSVSEPFEYFADFDDINPDDDEVSPRQQWLNRSI